MPDAGGITFYSVRGFPRLPAEQVEELQRRNVSGRAYRKTGSRGDPDEITVKKDVLAASLATEQSAQYAIQGSVITFTTDAGVTFTGYLCREVVVLEPQRIILSQGGVLGSGADYFLIGKWLVEPIGG